MTLKAERDCNLCWDEPNDPAHVTWEWEMRWDGNPSFLYSTIQSWDSHLHLGPEHGCWENIIWKICQKSAKKCFVYTSGKPASCYVFCRISPSLSISPSIEHEAELTLCVKGTVKTRLGLWLCSPSWPSEHPLHTHLFQDRIACTSVGY